MIKLINTLFVRFGTQAGVLGGGVTRFIKLTNLLSKRSKFFITTHETTYRYFKSLGAYVTPHYLVSSNWTWTICSIPQLIFCAFLSILKFRATTHFDVVWAWSHSLPDLLPSLWVKLLTKAKLVLYVQTPPYPYRKSRQLFRQFLPLYLDHALVFWIAKRKVDLILTLNPLYKQRLVQRGIDPAKIKIITSAADLDILDKIGEIPREYDAIFMGRLGKNKGVLDVIEVWKRVCEVKPQAKLRIVGPSFPEIFQGLKRRISESGIPSNILLMGPLYDEEKYRALKSSVIWINPAYDDPGMSIMAYEAMASGCAAVNYALEDYEYVLKDTILTAKVGDVEDLAKKVLYLIDNDVARKRLVNRSMKMARSLDWKKALLNEFGFVCQLLESDGFCS